MIRRAGGAFALALGAHSRSRILALFTVLSLLAGCHASHDLRMGCRVVSFDFNAGTSNEVFCAADEVIRGLYYADSSCSGDGCGDFMSKMRCCKLDASPSLGGSSLRTYDLETINVATGCPNGFFATSWRYVEIAPQSSNPRASFLDDWRTDCKRLPDSFSTNHQTTYRAIATTQTINWAAREDRNSWVDCPTGSYMIALESRKNYNMYDLSKMHCAYPHNKECPTAPLYVGGASVVTTFPQSCTHQYCQAQQSCATGYGPATPVTLECARNSGTWTGGTPLTCPDTNECNSNPCTSPAVCNNVVGSYECNCPSGYDTTSPGVCEDHNECDRPCGAEDPLQDNCHPCDLSVETCVNNPGAAPTCECQGTLERVPPVTGPCTPLDYCANNDCVGYEECVDGEDSFTCVCPSGYDAGAGCTNTDECQRKCTAGEEADPVGNGCNTCPDTPGFRCKDYTGAQVGFVCECRPGYDGPNCVNINECSEDPNSCPAKSRCHDTEGSFACSPYLDGLSIDEGGSIVVVDGSAAVVSVVEPAIAHRMSIVIRQPHPNYLQEKIFFGGSASPFYFSCNGLVNTAGDDWGCDMAPAGGQLLAVSFKYCLNGNLTCFTHRDVNTFDFAPPTLQIDTLRKVQGDSVPSSGGSGTSVQSLRDLGGEILWMNGNNFLASDLTQMSLRFGPVGDPTAYQCTILSLTRTEVECRTGPAAGTDLFFTISVGTSLTAQPSSPGKDNLFYSIAVPIVQTIRGCPGGPAGAGTQGCPTTGGIMITLSVEDVEQTGLNILVSSRACFLDKPTFALVSGNLYTFQCLLPPGVGLFKSVQLTHRADRVFSPRYDIVSYAAPSITELLSSSCTVNTALELTRCNTAGGTLSIRGSNFGADNAAVFVGGKFVPSTHVFSFSGSGDEAGLHGHLVTTIPPMNPDNAAEESRTVLIKQLNGQSSATVAHIMYAPCPAGTRKAGASCIPCGPGTYSTFPGSLECIECEPGYHQDRSNQQLCLPCQPAKSQPLGKQAECVWCTAGTYANATAAPRCLDCASGRFSAGRALQCTMCAKGKFQPDRASESCMDCGVGTYTASVGAVGCSPCRAGSVSTINGSQSCAQCPRGTFQPLQQKTSCTPCPEGTFSNELGAVRCLQCFPGHMNNGTGQHECVPCLAGEFQREEGKTTCSACDPGRYAEEAGSVDCSDCLVGRFSAAARAIECKQCVAGSYQDSEAQTSCQPCPEGRKNSLEGAQICDLCSPGTYQSANSSADCLLCPQGRAAQIKGALECAICDVGFFQGWEGQQECEACTAGRYSNASGVHSCTPCIAGSFQQDGGKRDCELCPPGTFSNEGAVKCQPCQAGSYAALPGSFTCGVCPKNAEAAGDAKRCVCQAGLYAETIETSGLLAYFCKACPLGAYCEKPGAELDTLETRPGYWRSKNTSLTFFRCIMPSVCPGGEINPVTGQAPCAAHRTGALCGVCEENYKSAGTGNDCVKCPNSRGEAWALSAIVVLLVIGLLIAMYVVVLKVTNTQQRGLLEATKLADQDANANLLAMLDGVEDGIQEFEVEEVGSDDDDDEDLTELERKQKKRQKQAHVVRRTTTVQTGFGDSFGQSQLSSTRSFLGSQGMRDRGHDNAATLKKAHRATSLLSRNAPNFMYKVKILVGFFQIATIISFQGEISWPRHFAAYIAVFNFLNFDFVPWQTLGCATGINFYGKALIACGIPVGVMLLLVAAFYLPMYCMDKGSMESQLNFQQKRAASWRQFVRLLLFTVFLLYPFVSRMVLSVYNCTFVDGVDYLLVDFNLRCWTPTWTTHAVIVFPFVFLYPLGIPLAYTLLLRKHRHHMREPATILQLGFLYEAYGDDRWYWEIADMGHKLILTSLIAFAPAFLAMIFNMVVLILYMVLLLVLSPYIRKGDDRMHLLAQTELYLLALVGWVLQNTVDGQLDPLLDILVSIVLIAITSGFLIAFLLSSGRSVQKLIKLKKDLDEQKKQTSSSSRANLHAGV